MAAAGSDDFYQGTFPNGFAWGTATASYQIEGAVKEEGRGESIWDRFAHTEGKTLEGATGDVACDSFHNYPHDIQLMKKMGVSHYRLSLSWSRILPDGTYRSFNPHGVDYYNRVIDGLKAAGIEPMVTLYHWDLPQALQDQGGWPEPELAQHFEHYARICFREFGDRVKLWLTFNEPICTVWLGYGIGEHAPGIKDPLSSTFKAAHTIIRAHSMAYHVYDKEFRPKQKGQIGISLNTDWCQPDDPTNPADLEASERLMQMKLGWYAEPIYGSGDYPDGLKTQMKKKAEQLGLTASPLPEFTEEEKSLNKGSFDFFGLNHYTTRLVTNPSEPRSMEKPSEAALMDVVEKLDPKWDRAASSWLYIVTWGLRRLLCWIKSKYNSPVIYVTENGMSDNTGCLEDTHRVEYIRAYINEMLKAVCVDGCDVRGYMLWSLMDNFEWAMGFSEKFGLHHVDFSHPNRTRTPKQSATVYAQIIKDNGFPDPPHKK